MRIRSAIIIICLTIYSWPCFAQMPNSLYDGMYSTEWEQERDDFARGIDRRGQATADYLRGLDRQRQEQERAINNLNISIPAQETQSAQKQAVQNNRAKQQAITNARIQAHNQRVRIHNQKVAARNKQKQIEAAKKQKQAEEARKQERLQKKEATYQQVSEETYHKLEGQTKAYQAAAAYASGEGAYRLREDHDVSRYEKKVQQGTGNAVNQVANSPRPKFSYDNGGLVIDPNKKYFLATWGEVTSDDLRFVEPKFKMPAGEHKNEWLSFCDSMPNSRAMVHLAIMREMCNGELPEIHNFPNYTAFVSPDGNTLFVVSKKGMAMAILNLDESENMHIRNKLYASGSIGIFDAKLNVFDTDKPLENPKLKDTELSATVDDVKISKKGDTVSGKMKVGSAIGGKTILEEFKETDKEKEKREQEEKEKGIGFGVGAGHEFEFKNMNSMKATVITFNRLTDKVAKVESIEVKAGQKVNLDVSSNANTKKGYGANASLGIEGLNIKGGKGYLYIGKKKIYAAKAETEISFGGKFGIKANSRSVTLSSGAISMGVGGDLKAFPLCK